MSIRVVLAEDNALLRDGVSRLVEAQADLELVGTCGDLPALLGAGRDGQARRGGHRHPHAADGHRRGHPGRRHAARPSTPRSAWSCSASTPSPAYALALLAEGSEGRAYLLKERVADVDELVAAIREVAAGGSVIDPKVVEALVAATAARPKSDLDRLTPRETEILGEMATGKSNAAIAATLVLSRAGGGEAHQLDLLEARPVRGARRQPPGQGRAALPERRREASPTPGDTWSHPSGHSCVTDDDGRSDDAARRCPVLVVDDQAPFRLAAAHRC